MKVLAKIYTSLALTLCFVFGFVFITYATTYTEDDFIRLRKCLIGFTASDSGLDVNGDGEITVADLVRMKKNLYTQDDNELPFIPKQH